MTSNKHLIWLPIALLAGLVLGRMGPRAELREKDKLISDLEQQVRDSRQGQAQIAGISRMLQMPEETASALTKNNDSNPDSWSGASPHHKHRDTDGDVKVDKEEDESRMAAQIEKAAEIWDMRQDMARGNFVTSVALNEEQEKHFELIMAAMNVRLQPIFEAWAEDLKSGNSLVAESSTRYLNEITGAVTLVYDEMDRTMPEGWRGNSGDNFNAGDFIDPAVFAPLVDVEDRLQQWGPRE